MVFLYILAIYGAFVGMSLGVLLPMFFPGICFGGSLTLLALAVGALLNPYFFPLIGGGLALLFMILASR